MLISSDPENRMFPGPCDREEEVHASMTRAEGEEGAAGGGRGGLDFPLQPTEAQRTIQRFLWGRCQDCQLGAHSASGISVFLSKLWAKILKSPQTDAPKSPILIFKRLSTKKQTDRHQPPDQVIRMGIFILGAQLWGVQLSGPQDLQYPVQSLRYRHRTALLCRINDVDDLDEKRHVDCLSIVSQQYEINP